MTPEELRTCLDRGEDSQQQFKRDVTNARSLAGELVAFANGQGGRLFIGVADDGSLAPLGATDVRRINQLLSNAATELVRPPISPLSENIVSDGGVVMMVTVAPGANRPYTDHEGCIWVKSGADKRRVTAREEMQRLFQQAHLIHGDEVGLAETSVANLDSESLREYIDTQLGPIGEAKLERVARNLNLLDAQGQANIAGMLLFGKQPQFRLPLSLVKAVAFPGTSITDTSYLDSKDIGGRLPRVFDEALQFCLRNLHWRQGEQSVNSEGRPEIPRLVLEELIANALVHRDYFISSTVRLLLFRDRIEVISPGHLPNSLNVDQVRTGVSNMRNPTLATHAARLLPYRGLGSGILRSLKAWPDVEFFDDREGNQFRVIIQRQIEEV